MRYNVRIEDVMKLINMAIGGEPVSTLYEEERRFDIVARLDKRRGNRPKPSGGCPSIRPTACPSPGPGGHHRGAATAKPSSAASTAAAA